VDKANRSNLSMAREMARTSTSWNPLARLSPWILATRPRTLSLSTMPVLVGGTLAWAVEGHLHWPALLFALAGSILIQLGTNLHNDATGLRRGGDGADRFGPRRATASGLLEGGPVNATALACFAAAALIGCYLVWVGGWPIFLLGVAAILSGWAYNGGPLPVAYTPLGELFVLVFFGLGAVCGTYWLCTGDLNAIAVEASLAVGFFAAAVLLVNNKRDVKADARVGRCTLAIFAGPRLTNWIYAGFVLAPFALLVPIGLQLPRGHIWPAFVSLPVVAFLISEFVRERDERGLNRVLGQTVQTQMLFALLLCVGLFT
jgi:1,4-dihydroxy-2-naphthoate octaprenyltransferase